MRKRLLPLFSALTLFTGLASADETESCKTAGTIFTIDPLGGTLIIKDATGYLKNVAVACRNIDFQTAGHRWGQYNTDAPWRLKQRRYCVR